MTATRDLIVAALAEDGAANDLTANAVVPADARALATITQKAPGVIAGLDVARETFGAVDEGLSVTVSTDEGVWRDAGPVLTIEGLARPILAAERVALNFLGRLWGIATLTARFVTAVEGTGAQILDTRKTAPGLRELEKGAVVAGGGVSHRAGLHDAILVKENHAALAGGVGEAARRALAEAPEGVRVQVECATLEDLDQALDAGVELVLLDNMGLDELRAAVERAAGRAVLEASGGITLENVRAIAETGVERISIGALTHSAPALDLSLTLEPRPS